MILDTIVQQKREEVAELKKNGIRLPESFIGRTRDKSRGFKQALISYPGVSIIAEVKKASPSNERITGRPSTDLIRSRLPGTISCMVPRRSPY